MGLGSQIQGSKRHHIPDPPWAKWGSQTFWEMLVLDTGRYLYNKFDPQPWSQGWEKSSSVAPAPSALPPWRRRISKVTFPTAVRVRWSGASWTRRPKPSFWISAPACRQSALGTITARRVGFAVRFRLRDYLRHRFAHSDPHLYELLASEPGVKITTYLDFYHKNTCYSANWGSGSAGSACFWASRILIR